MGFIDQIIGKDEIRYAVSILAVLFVGGLGWMIIRWWKITSDLKRIDAFSRKLLSDSRFISFEQLDVLSKEFSSCDLVAHSWTEFEDTIVKEDNGNLVEVFNSRPLSDFFSQEEVLERKFNAETFRKFPSVITSAGLFFTFLFIVIGLSSLESQNGVLEGVDGLVEGLKYKFYSSIVGLAFAVLFIIIEDRVSRGIEGRHAKFVDFIERKFRRKTPENYLMIIGQQMRDLNVSMKHFSTDLAGVIKEGLAEGMRPSTDSLLAAISNLERQKTENISDTIGKLLNEFKSSLSQSAGSEFAELGTSVSKLAGSMELQAARSSDLIAKFDNLLAEMDVQVSKQAQSSEAAVENLNDSFGKLLATIEANTTTQRDALARLMDELVQKTSSATGGIVDNVKSLTSQNQSMITEMAILSDSTKASMSKYQEVIKSTSGLIAATSSVSDSVAANLKKLSDLELRMHDLSAKFITEAGAIQSIQHSNAEGLERYNQVFKVVDSGLSNALRQIADNMQRYNDLTNSSLDKYLKQYDESLSQATRRLAATVKELDETLDLLAATLSKGKEE
jgi:hypothetical protein